MSIQDISGRWKTSRRPKTLTELRVDRSHEKSTDELRAEIATLKDEIAELKTTVQELQPQ